MKKIFKLVLSSILVAAFFYLLVRLLDGNVVAAAIMMIPVGLLAFFFRLSARQTAAKRAKDYDWYRQTYPDAFRNNRVTCRGCGNGRIHIKNVMNKTYLRDHFCAECGETLFYSPEGIQKSPAA